MLSGDPSLLLSPFYTMFEKFHTRGKALVFRKKLLLLEIPIRSARVDEWSLYECLEDEFGNQQFRIEVSPGKSADIHIMYVKRADSRDWVDDHRDVSPLDPSTLEQRRSEQYQEMTDK